MSAHQPNHKQKVGAYGEAIARSIYVKNGFVILANNFVNEKGRPVGEIDFIALRNKELRFVEVKARSSYAYGDPIESITNKKVLRIRKAIGYFFLKFPEFRRLNRHFDAVTIKLSPVDKRIEKIRIYLDVIVDSY
ncbi:MAG: hypothetical protein JWO40_227 [Candidatus Doudnabacteria bacterium]|nr:hypothetical protein [Candidatus Doudnabacteria bacterium]